MTKHVHRPCPRCGIMGERRANAALCKDCRYVLSKEEIKAWTPKVAA